MADLTSTTLLETVFSGLTSTELKHYTARGMAYFDEFDATEVGGELRHQHSIDPLPFILSSDDSRLFAQSVIQWGQLLEASYHDLRGAQSLVVSAAIPAAALWRDAAIDPALNKLLQATRNPMSMMRLDLVKDRSSGWNVVSVGSGPPRGLGFALETRIIHGRIFSAVLNRSKVMRLAPFFRNLKQQWFTDALHHLDEPAVMIWTPGPVDPDYAEHIYLCRYFGYPLVESRDLTVRSGKVYLKMLGGLRPVDVLVRMVGDYAIDPLSGNPPAMDGVAGLVQAIRDSEVFVTNMPGTDVLEHPALLPHVAAAARELTGSNLLLPYKPQIDNTCTEPFWNDGAWTQQSYMVSIFAAKTEQGWECMPGGLSRPLIHGPQGLSLIHQGPCKDVWLMSTHAVPFVSLLPQRERPSDISRTNDLPSRVADDLFWLGRYSERAWVDLRFLGKWLEVSAEDGDESFQKRTRIIQDCVSSMEIGTPDLHAADAGKDWRLWNTLRDMEHIASRVRDRFSLETHHVIGNLSALVPSRSRKNLPLRETIEQASLNLAAFNGFTNEHMTRGSGWHFLDIGKRLERATLLTEAVAAFCAHEPEPDDLTMLLELFDSMITYRSRYYFAPELGPLLDLLILDESNPRSLAFQVLQLQEHLQKIPHNQNEAYRNDGERNVLRLLTNIRLAEGPQLALVSGRQHRPALDAFLASVLSDLNAISDAVHRIYLVKLEALQRIQAHDLADHS